MIIQLLQKSSTDAETIKISNKDDKPKKRGIITVAAGEGIKDILTELGADEVIFGGQSMNPSTNDFVQALEKT